MKTLDRYIGRTVASHIGVVLFVLLAMYFFSALVTEMGDVGKGRYTTTAAVQFTLMLIPRQIYELFPLVALLGAMLGLGALANTSELTVMRAAGVSIRRIVLAVLKTGLLLVAVVVVVGETVAPQLEKLAYTERVRLLARNISLNTEDGLWARDGNAYINIRRLFANGTASDIHVFRLDGDLRLVETITARRGTYEEGAWRLRDVQISRIGPAGIGVEKRGKLRWESSLTPAVIDVGAVAPENLSVQDLLGYLRYMRDNGLEDRRYSLALWLRVLMPFATVGMLLLAIPFVFGSMRSVGIGQRIMVGALIGIGFYLFNAIFSRIGVVYAIPPLISAALPTVLVYLLWWRMMRRVF